MLNRHQRRAQYATTSRSKPLCKARHPKKKLESVMRGRDKIMRLISRGIDFNRKYIKLSVNPVAEAVRKGIVGRLFE